MFLRSLFPSVARINYEPDVPYETNNVMLHNCIQYGHIGSGKTETVRAIVEEAVKKYGSENVNPVVSRNGDIVELLEYGMNDKMIQILIADDATLRKIKDSDIRKFFKARHVYKSLTGKSNGFILTIFNVHRFHGLTTELRTNIDMAIWKTLPTSPYDRSIVKKFVGEDGLDDLKYIESMRLEEPKWNSISVFTSRLWTGLVVLPLAKQDYLLEVERDTSGALTWGQIAVALGG